jgi:hypothetical protein
MNHWPPIPPLPDAITPFTVTPAPPVQRFVIELNADGEPVPPPGYVYQRVADGFRFRRPWWAAIDPAASPFVQLETREEDTDAPHVVTEPAAG